MRYWLSVILTIIVGSLYGQSLYKITYQRSYNGSVTDNQDPIVVYTTDNYTLITSEQILAKTKKYPFEQTYIDRTNNNLLATVATLAADKSLGYVDSLAIPNQNFTFLPETKNIGGYICKRARTVVNSNSIEFWYTPDLKVKGSPNVLGSDLGLVLELNVNNTFQISVVKIEKQPLHNAKIKLSVPQNIQLYDNLTYKDLIWKSSFTTIPVFENETINFSDQALSNDSILRFGKGSVALRKVKFPNISTSDKIFIDLETVSNGDAYDRLGSVFMVPLGYKRSFLDGFFKGLEHLPVYKNGNGKEYQGITLTSEFCPLVELMRFITPFGIGKYNSITLKDKTWHDKAVYRQDISELQSLLSDQEVYIGVFIGNYDSNGHKVSLNITVHPEQELKGKRYSVVPIFNTVNVLEMASQEYSTMFSVEAGLEVEFTLPKNLKNAKLRYITTGHGGWGNGDEFNPKRNTILLNGNPVISFIPWREDCGSYRLFNPASGNFKNGLSSSDYSRSNWCPGMVTYPMIIELGDLPKGKHKIQIKIPQGPTEGASFSSWNVSGLIIGE